jgi:NADPH-dependent 2,4-dienoyl-CoA reductase/sulfur reductase-like enzyme/rhodanese-related sulfurtransferase
MPEKIVIIGGSAAGPKVASKARRLDQEAEITIIQKGKYLSMASCGYPYYVGGVFDNRNMLISTPTGAQRDPTFFSKVKDIKAIVNTEAKAIDRSAKMVAAENLETGEQIEIPYDKLVITTGATAFVPDLPGIDLEGITTLQSMEDAEYLKQIVVEKKIKKAVIVGGGLIGIESCEALELAGFEVTVVEMLDQVLPFLDWEMAKLVENYMISKNMQIRTSTAVTGFTGENGKLKGVKLNNGSRLACDLAVIAIGVRPNAKLAGEAGLEIGQKGGITVNRFMQTNDQSIYAAGDCVEVNNLVTQNKQHFPMGDLANLQGRVAAQNVVFGNIEEFEGVVGTGICKIADYRAGGTGLSEKMARAEGYANIITAIHAAPDKPGFMGGRPIIIKMIADKTTGKLLGMQAVGLGDVAKRVAMAAVALLGRLSISQMVNLDLPYAPPFSPAIDNFIAAVHVIENKWRNKMTGISCREVKNKIDAGEDFYLLDVRGPEEYEQMRLGVGEELIPLGSLRNNLDKLPRDKDKEIIVYCKISLRGYEASCFLSAKGYTNVKVMEGGLIAWPFKREK